MENLRKQSMPKMYMRVVPSSTRRKTTLSQRRCNFEDHARILAVQLNGLVAKLRTAHNTAEEVDFLTREPVVRVWDIQAELAAMWLSNGLLQVNWRQGEERLKLMSTTRPGTPLGSDAPRLAAED
ncbi:hypothetical protein WR25_23469 [Diploscapter pachys]|uniref:Uncharacterized protein n=1 Tax=Diploscapter pachys TaxID=2018661 RepID=A0A2A2LDJ6_9BILA|nr:hypothetical protein WR25_23469 [Diploscapter pachys]